MADRAAGEQKSMLLTMAQTWESLADDREEHLARQKRLAALEMMGN